MAQLKLRLSPAPVDGNPWNTYENPENIHEHPIKKFMCNIYIYNMYSMYQLYRKKTQ
jgi:hypothetical protein